MADRLEHDVPNHHPEPGVIPVPHGPDTHTASAHLPNHNGIDAAEEDRILSAVLKPSDSYVDGVYWADLPRKQRFMFTNGQFWQETWRELRHLRAITTWRRPYAPLLKYWHASVVPGAGLGLEGYVLFSIGNLAPLFASRYPECWDKHGSHAVCTKNVVASVTYLEITGIMVGQVLVGIIGDMVGRRWGLVQDALIMTVGLIVLTASWGTTLQGWVICYAIALFVYGIGVGGEYPMTATSAMENAVGSGKVSTREDRLHRGRKVTLSFLMQGVGQFVNQLALLFLLYVSNDQSLDPPYQDRAAQITFRVSVCIIILPTAYLAWWRFLNTKGASLQLDLSKAHMRRNNVTGYDFGSIRACYQHFGGRLLATSGTWFANDVFFYGNKLFQGAFINVISGNTSKGVSMTWQWNLCNIAVSLVGYYLAAFLIDHKSYGRKRMQAVGFFFCFIFIVIPGYKYEYFTRPENIHAFQAMYFLSSFFNQFGPNAVTFLVAGEVFPAPVRASAHGFAACVGKAGALLAAVLLNYISTEQTFLIVPWFGLVGLILNVILMPDTTGLDLKEQERRWRYIREGRKTEYHGIAVHPRHLSMWENWWGVGKQYDPALDYEQRRQDLREEWERNEAAKAGLEVNGQALLVSDTDNEDFPPHVHEYFKRTRGGAGGSPIMKAIAEKQRAQLEKTESREEFERRRAAAEAEKQSETGSDTTPTESRRGS